LPEPGYDSVIVLGHTEYYPMIGFKQADMWGIKDPFGAPAEAFMALELDEGALEVFLNSWPSKMALIYGA
jgi:putative acetyltransferase